MFAVIKTGGKQYRVAADDVISIEKLPGEPGDQITFGDVLVVGDGDEATLGAPLVSGASVAGEVVSQGRGRKILVFKKKRRKHQQRTKGHRQHYTLVRITDILTDGAKPKARKAEPAAEKKAAGETKAETKPAEAKSKAEAKPKAEAKKAEAETAAAKPKAEAKKAAPKKAADKPAAKKADKAGDKD